MFFLDFLDFVLFGIVVDVTCTGLSTRHGDRGAFEPVQKRLASGWAYSAKPPGVN